LLRNGRSWIDVQASVLAVVCFFFSEAHCFCQASSFKLPSRIYDGPTGAAFVQIGDVMINGKTELRDCTPYPAAGVDKSSYGKMQKVAAGADMIWSATRLGFLRYGASGIDPALRKSR